MKTHCVETVLSGTVLPDIGQVTDEDRKEFKRLIRAGVVVKWRGYWYPVAGANWGLGPKKICYGLCSKLMTGEV